MPLLAGADGGSGSRSTYENRNASGHDVNVDSELGDNEPGTGWPARSGAPRPGVRRSGWGASAVMVTNIPPGCDSHGPRRPGSRSCGPRRVAITVPAMKIDTGIMAASLSDIGPKARELEELGYDGVITAETGHDSFLPLVLAAEHTERLELGTGIAVAFARTPMVLAYTANDLQLMSKGRFILGLGSQIKPHIEKRFSMPWSHPARRMREYILALHAIWDSWNDGTRLKFDGEFYQHTLMTPFFSPGANPYGKPRVFLAAVGEMMTEVAGEVADGIIIHGFTTERYVKEVTMPAIERGLAKAGRDRSSFEVSGPLFVVTGTTDAEVAEAERAVKQQIAFYGSTPAYRGVLELHGWGDLQTELNALSKQGEWVKMGELIDDDILHTFAVVADPEGVATELKKRYGGVVDRCSFYAPYRSDPDRWQAVIDGLKSA